MSSLPISGKIFERICYNNVFSFFLENTLLLKNNPNLTMMILVETNFYQRLKNRKIPLGQILPQDYPSETYFQNIGNQP